MGSAGITPFSIRYRGSSNWLGSPLFGSSVVPFAPLIGDIGATRGESGIRFPWIASKARYLSCQNASNCRRSSFKVYEGTGCCDDACWEGYRGKTAISAVKGPRRVMLYPFV